MKLKLQLALPIALTTGVLSSCITERVRVDMGLVTEAFSGPQNDAVIVERGRGLSSSARPALTEPQYVAVATPTPTRPAATAPVAQPKVATATSQMRPYIVQPGDTLSRIAARYGVTTAQLVKANNLGASANSLKVGQRLIIPAPGAAVASRPQQVATTAARPTSASFTMYEVKARDTLYGIAVKHGTTVSRIREVNGFSAAQVDKLRVGQIIKIPTK